MPGLNQDDRHRAMLVGDVASMVQVDRVARVLCRMDAVLDGGMEEEARWSRFLDEYRARARKILTTGDGWETLGR